MISFLFREDREFNFSKEYPHYSLWDYWEILLPIINLNPNQFKVFPCLLLIYDYFLRGTISIIIITHSSIYSHTSWQHNSVSQLNYLWHLIFLLPFFINKHFLKSWKCSYFDMIFIGKETKDGQTVTFLIECWFKMQFLYRKL